MSARAMPRYPIPVLLAVMVVVALLAGDADGRSRPRASEPRDSAVGAPAAATSSAWFCPQPPPGLDLGSESLAVTNVGDTEQRVILTVHPDGGATPVSVERAVEAQRVTTFARDELGPPGALVVEAFSPHVYVESGAFGDGIVASNPCASVAARVWHFAAGTTSRGVQQFLVLFNPLGTDAKVDIALRTNEGSSAPEALQSLDVPRRSRVVVPVHDHAVRAGELALDVTASVGRVVAEQHLVFGEDSGTAGVGRTLGVLRPSHTWTFVGSSPAAGASAVLALSNPGLLRAEIDLLVTAAADAPVEPVTVTLPPDRVLSVQVGGCTEPQPADCVPVPPATGYVIAVESDPAAPVVAEVLTRAGAPAGGGASLASASSSPSSRWIVPRAAGPAGGSVVTVANPGVEPVTVDVALVSDGRTERPGDLQAVEVGPGARFDVEVAGARVATAVLVTSAGGDVVVNRSARGDGDGSEATAIAMRATP